MCNILIKRTFRLAINSFTNDAKQAEFSIAGDTAEGNQLVRKLQRWDRKKKKMVNVEVCQLTKMKII